MTFILTLMIAFLIVMSVLQKNVQIAEAWTRGFGRQYTKAMSDFNKLFPFSLTETSFIIVLFSCVFFLGWGFSFLGNKKVWPFVHRALMVTLIIVGSVTMYNASVGFAYTRASLPIEGYKGEIIIKAIPDVFVEHASQKEQLTEFGLNPEDIIKLL